MHTTPNKNRDWNASFTKDDFIYDKSKLVGLRATWADYVNHALTDSGSGTQVSHLSNKEQELDRKPQNLDFSAYQINKKGNYSEIYYSQLRTKNAEFNQQFKKVIKSPAFQEAVRHQTMINEWEYMQARLSVEVDTRNYVAPPTPRSYVECLELERENDLDGFSR